MTMGECAVQHDAAQKPKEVDRLIELLPRPLGTVIEVGSAEGGLTWVWRWLFADKIICVDNRPDLPKHRYPPDVLYVENDSAGQLARCWIDMHLGGGLADVVFIDAGHRYEQVKADWHAYRPLVKLGGLCCFHDIIYHPTVPDCQVDRLWREIVATSTYKTVEIIEEPKVWGGIGVVYC